MLSSSVATIDRLSFATSEITELPRGQADWMDGSGLLIRSGAAHVAFVDAGLDDVQTLVAGLRADTVVYLLDSAGDGLSQMTQVLAGYRDLASVAIFSHGSNGNLQLGNLNLDSSALGEYSDDLQQWVIALTPDADILLYGCNLAADGVGQSFIQQLSQLTGADVAASTDLTGSAALGGDWDLEFATGSIEASAFLAPWAQAAYQHVLANYTVTSTADSGAGSLREAINLANASAGADTIDFSTSGTITLTGELTITNDLTINGNNSITISGNNDFRVFNIDDGIADAKTVTLVGLTITEGRNNSIFNRENLTVTNSTISGNSGYFGGGIFSGGSLTVTNSTISGNFSNNDGGGIFSSGSLTVTNSTISGNSTDYFGGSNGGGILSIGTLNLSNSTISGNSSTNEGGGIDSIGTLNLSNSIVAGNTAPNRQEIASFDSGSFNVSSVTSGGYNLFGVNGNSGLSGIITVGTDVLPGAGVLIGNILNPTLANNGGPTQTLALVAGSLAINAGNTALTTDQRGIARPQGAADDIGAFEYVSPNSAPTTSGIANVAVNEDAAPTSINLFTAFADTETADAGLTYTLVSNSNPALFSSTGITSGNLNLTYAANANGNANLTVRATDPGGLFVETSFTVTVTPVNDAPVATGETLTDIAEDSGVRMISFASLLGNDSAGPANESGQTLTIVAVSNVVGGSAVINGANIEFTPIANYNGAASLQYTVQDNGTTNGINDFKIATATATFNITTVNDAPTATNDTLTDIAKDSGLRTIAFSTLLGNDSAGPNESSQSLTITAVSNVLGGTATISGTNILFTPTANYNGPASFQYTVQDNGTTSGAADPKSATATASFNITAVNDAPTATNDTLTDIAEDSGVRTIAFSTLLGNDSAGSNESSQTLTITNVSNVVGGTATISGTNILFTPIANYNGAASFQYTVQDNGTTNGVNDFKTATATATFNITAVNDTPVVATPLNNQSSPEDTAVNFTIPANTFSDVDNPTLSLSATLGDNSPLPAWLSFNAATRTFSGTPPANFNGSLALKVTATDAGNLSASSTFDLVIIAVNDAPVVNLTSPTQSIANTNSLISGITLSDVDAGTNPVVVTLKVNSGTLNVAAQSGVTIANNNTGTVTLTGSIANLNTALTSLRYTSSNNFSGNDSLTIAVNDQGNTGTGGSLSDSKAIALTVNRDLGSLSATPNLKSGTVNATDPVDFYQFTVTRPSNLSLNLVNLSTAGDTDLAILDSNGNVVASSNNPGFRPESIRQALTAGTYRIRIRILTGATQYLLTSLLF
jgi:hypothetical protein